MSSFAFHWPWRFWNEAQQTWKPSSENLPNLLNSSESIVLNDQLKSIQQMPKNDIRSALLQPQ